MKTRLDILKNKTGETYLRRTSQVCKDKACIDQKLKQLFNENSPLK